MTHTCPGLTGFNIDQPSITAGLIVWWMGVDYELIFQTLCTHSDLLVIHSLGYNLLGQCGFLTFTDYVGLDTDILITFLSVLRI